MDLATLIGIVAGFGLVGATIAMGPDPGGFIDIHSVLIGSVPVPVGPDLATLRHERLVAVGRQYDPGGMGC